MRAFIVPKGCKSIDELRIEERPDPEPGPGQVLIRVRAASLNYRDQALVAGRYGGGPTERDIIPVSDAAGEVVAVGDGVTRVKPGDAVMNCFSQIPPSGPRSAPAVPLGSPLDGVLAEQVVFYEEGVIPLPDGYTFEEAATLPCAGVTAWHALMEAGRPVTPGDTVLILGTGGVSMFGLQFAKAAGANVIATSSSDKKLARLKELGAAAGINYKTTPEWHEEVMKATDGRGADCVVEVGGMGTLNRSFQSLARGGKIGLIGVLTQGESNPHILMMKGGHLHGILVGPRDMFERMNQAITVNGIKPVIDRVFAFEEAADAYRHQASGDFMGKVVITV